MDFFFRTLICLRNIFEGISHSHNHLSSIFSQSDSLEDKHNFLLTFSYCLNFDGCGMWMYVVRGIVERFQTSDFWAKQLTEANGEKKLIVILVTGKQMFRNRKIFRFGRKFSRTITINALTWIIEWVCLKRVKQEKKNPRLKKNYQRQWWWLSNRRGD